MGRNQVRGTVVTAAKVVGGAFYEQHQLSDGSSIIELTGIGSYQSVGVGQPLMDHVEQVAHDQRHVGVILLAVPSAIEFYQRCGYSFLTETRNPVERALYYLSCKASFRHAAMLKYV
ncbi:ACOT13 [Symbiodinium sp. CCMP2592]|nr:ACOT13 [Symbiodinium sp. CCMP2592]